MKQVLELSAEQIFEIERGLSLRVAQCKRRSMTATSTAGKLKYFEQLTCAVSLLQVVQALALTESPHTDARDTAVVRN